MDSVCSVIVRLAASICCVLALHARQLGACVVELRTCGGDVGSLLGDRGDRGALQGGDLALEGVDHGRQGLEQGLDRVRAALGERQVVDDDLGACLARPLGRHAHDLGDLLPGLVRGEVGEVGIALLALGFVLGERVAVLGHLGRVVLVGRRDGLRAKAVLPLVAVGLQLVLEGLGQHRVVERLLDTDLRGVDAARAGERHLGLLFQHGQRALATRLARQRAVGLDVGLERRAVGRADRATVRAERGVLEADDARQSLELVHGALRLVLRLQLGLLGVLLLGERLVPLVGLGVPQVDEHEQQDQREHEGPRTRATLAATVDARRVVGRGPHAFLRRSR